jgi:hypothetical protein
VSPAIEDLARWEGQVLLVLTLPAKPPRSPGDADPLLCANFCFFFFLLHFQKFI